MPCLEEMEENDAKKRARLLDSLSRSFPSSALSKMLRLACDENLDPLGSSCFADVGVEKFHSKEEIDDELTSLAWLQDANLLKNIAPSDGCASPRPKFDSPSLASLPDVNYDSLLHGKHKPPFSFSCLIFMAIEASPAKCLPVRGIYDWIVRSFPYFVSAPTGWRNSVRHNLSLNKCFKKVDRDCRLGIGKGSSWCIDPKHRPNLLQALRRTPYHPFQQLQMISSVASTIKISEHSSNEPKKSQEKIASAAFGTHIRCTEDANNLHGASHQHGKRRSAFADVGKVRERIMQDIRLFNDSDDLVCTAYPNEDHIYSIPGLILEETRAAMDSNSVDEGLDSGSESEQEEDLGPDDAESGSTSSVNLTDESEKCFISRRENHIKETVAFDGNKTAVSRESKKRKCIDSDENDEQKTLYFTSLALLELAAGKRPISFGNTVQEMALEKKYDSREKLRRARRPGTRVSKRGRKVSFAPHKGTSKKRDEPLIAPCRVGKRKCKQLLPITSSLWGKRRKLPNDNVNLECLPKKASAKKILSTERKQKIVRHRRKK